MTAEQVYTEGYNDSLCGFARQRHLDAGPDGAFYKAGWEAGQAHRVLVALPWENKESDE